jgi:hypothetical protein
VFFFEKKNQKTFSHGSDRERGKSFLLLFFKKEVLAFRPGDVAAVTYNLKS